MRILALLLLAATAFAADTIEAFGYKWTVPAKADWAVEGSGASQVLKMLVQHPDKKELPRRPVHFAVAETAPFAEVTIDVEVRRGDPGSVMIAYAWQDANHFNYAHLSPDAGAKQPVHNGIFHVYGGDRVRISNTEGPGTLPGTEWTPVHFTYSAKTHLCEVTVAGKLIGSMRGVDLSLGAGRIGLGSFFNASEFRNLKIKGK
jgi:hypothetical protein